MSKTKKSVRIIALLVVIILMFASIASAIDTRAVYWLAANSSGTSCGSHYFDGSRSTIQLGANTANYNLYVWLSQNGDLKYGKKWMSSAISGSYLWTVTPAAGTYTIMAANNRDVGYNINFAIS